eukprot:CAMPEP_0181222938 /NCGR_PEP_ID=MMETSP1096-20121128/30243_1 /TAXON_ID=156174 ORGANISM="Chrysochromulina ericina, Strain CCMP281" /NCGR_SAMPLE_ID=MMETSP1096 /ASSEMBLY_ACC=CAM_ASM_000453 /LENGTH=183 /DNA_ID=CAMNT_0023315753 /DNA_START=292 /DNA_END=842 /DNA_ORIENTATION=+
MNPAGQRAGQRGRRGKLADSDPAHRSLDPPSLGGICNSKQLPSGGGLGALPVAAAVVEAWPKCRARLTNPSRVAGARALVAPAMRPAIHIAPPPLTPRSVPALLADAFCLGHAAGAVAVAPVEAPSFRAARAGAVYKSHSHRPSMHRPRPMHAACPRFPEAHDMCSQSAPVQPSSHVQLPSSL